MAHTVEKLQLLSEEVTKECNELSLAAVLIHPL